MAKTSVLVVDDEAKIRDVVRTYLEHDGYAVFEARNGEEALEAAQRLGPDLVVLDLMLPDLTGEEVARSLREVSEVPIIMLTAKASEDDRVAGLRLGADDYLAKPFSPRELVARVEAVLRRAKGAEPEASSFDGAGLRIDTARREVFVEGRPVPLLAASSTCSPLLPPGQDGCGRATNSSPGSRDTTTTATSAPSTRM